MNELEIKFKADTGQSAFLEIESLSMTETIDTYPLQGEDTVEDVINLIDSMDYDWAVCIKDIPKEYINHYDFNVYRPEYVKWLEEQLNTLTK